MFFLFKLHLDFLHFFTNALVWGHFARLEEHLSAESEEEACSKEVCDRLGDEGGDSVAQ